MPTLIPTDTERVLGPNARNCDSRSLLLDRFADPAAKDNDHDKERTRFFEHAFRQTVHTGRSRAWSDQLQFLAAADRIRLLFAQLQARLMVDMAGGVMGNAGLCLDRFGLPSIPGSAVKGCARRTALAALHEWCETGCRPGGDQPPANLFGSTCEPFPTADAMLAAIARVFGWSESDWTRRRDFRSDEEWAGKRSDLAWACGDTLWEALREKAISTLAPVATQRGHGLPSSYAGEVSFFEASPVDLQRSGELEGLAARVPDFGRLELDIVTCHHPGYYEGRLPVATDTEEPNPVVFPSVAAGHVFAFPLAPLRCTSKTGVSIARDWLACGLRVFGLGAKTNAGYGWFESGERIQAVVAGLLAATADRRRRETERLEEAKRQKDELLARQLQANELAAALVGLAPEQQADLKIARLTDDQFRGRLESFADREPSEQQAIVRALRLPPGQAGSRRRFWDELRKKAQKGGKPARCEMAIRGVSAQLLPGKEGKMP